MKIFAIIVFALAVIRTITPFGIEDTYKKWSVFMGRFIVCVTMICAYIWFLQQFITLK